MGHGLFRAILLAMLSGGHRELALQIQYLKAENEILRRRLPKRVVVTPREKAVLLRFGRPLGRAIDQLISIVSPRTFARWARGERRDGRPARRGPGRPAIDGSIRDLVLRMRRETGWGSARIHMELGRLGVGPVSRSAIAAMLRAAADGDPRGGPTGTWDAFIRAHADTLWACDFFSRRVWTPRGLVEHFVLRFVVMGRRHLDHLVREFVAHYHHERPHMALGGRTVLASDAHPPDTSRSALPIARRERLGGCLVWYERAA